MFKSGKVTVERQTLRKMSLKSNEALGWMANFFDRVGDRLPDKSAIHLPSMLTIKCIYSRMNEEIHAQDSDVISQAQFYHLWKEFYPHVSIPAFLSLLVERGIFSEVEL